MGVPREIYWHIALVDEDCTEMEAYYIHSLFEKYGSVKKILDVACGVGRHHKYLRALGYDVYGVDADEELIKKAKERNGGFEEKYTVMDMREKLPKEFDGLFLLVHELWVF